MAQILVLDDDDAILAFVREALSDEHAVTCLGNGEEGMAACASGCYELVITDLFMPFKDGLEFIREAKTACPKMKIIAITGETVGMAKNYLELAANLGADATLRKPLNIADLRATVNEVLSGAR